MPRLRLTVDGKIEKQLSSDQIQELVKDVKAHIVHSVFPDYEDEVNKFNDDEVNITIHNHMSSPQESCQFCYRELSGDEKN